MFYIMVKGARSYLHRGKWSLSGLLHILKEQSFPDMWYFFRFYNPREIYVFPNQMHVPPLKTILDGRQEIDLVTCWSHAGLRRFPATMQSGSYALCGSVA